MPWGTAHRQPALLHLVVQPIRQEAKLHGMQGEVVEED